MSNRYTALVKSKTTREPQKVQRWWLRCTTVSANTQASWSKNWELLLVEWDLTAPWFIHRSRAGPSFCSATCGC